MSFLSELASASAEMFAELPTEQVGWSGQDLTARVPNLNVSASLQRGGHPMPDGEFVITILDTEFTGAERPKRTQTVTVQGVKYAITAADVRPGHPHVTLTLSA